MPGKLSDFDPAVKYGADIDVNVDLNDFVDADGNELLELDTVASAVNYVRLANAAASSNPTISAQGDDTNVSLTVDLKGTGGLSLDASGATTGNALDISVAALTEGKGIDLSDLDAITTGKAIHVDATGTTHTSGKLVHIDSAGTAMTGAGRLLHVDHTGATSTSGIVAEVSSAANDETVIAKITASAALAAGIALDISAVLMQTGKAIDISDLDAITTGKALHVDATGVTQTSGILVHLDSASTAITGAGRIFLSDHTGASASNAVLNEFTSAATDETIILRVKASDALALGRILDVDATAMTTGSAIIIDTLNALTTGKGVMVEGNATAITTTGRMFYVNHTGATSTSGILAEFKTSATDETVLLELDSAATTGIVLDINVASTTANSVTIDGTAFTTGGALVITDNSANTGTRSVVKIVQDHASATGATALEVQQDGDSYAILISGATTKGINLTAIGAGEPALNFTDGNASAIDPSATAESGWINIAVGGTLKYIPYYAAA